MAKPHNLKVGQRVRIAFETMPPVKGRLIALDDCGTVATVKATGTDHELIMAGEKIRVSLSLLKPRRD